MLKKLLNRAKLYWPTASVVFKVFWILVFAVDAPQGGGSAEIPEFVYVNF